MLGASRDELRRLGSFSGGEFHELGVACEHKELPGARFERGAELQANPKYLDYVVETLGPGASNSAPAPGAPAPEALMGSTSLLGPEQASVYRSCAGALMYFAQDRADAQYAVSLLGRMLSGPTTGSFAALKR